MNNLLGISNSGLHAFQYQMDTIANDIANVNTTGYKARQTDFEELLTNVYQDNNRLLMSGNIADLEIQTGSRSGDYTVDFTQGSLVESPGSYQFAIAGEGFFQVAGRDGDVYFTRDGDFELDQAGTNVVNARGELVTMNGNVPAVFQPAVGVEMLPVGENKYVPQGAMGASNSEVIVGYVEQSNVDLATSFSDMIIAQRAYSMNIKAAQSTDEMMSLINQFKQ